MNPYEITFYERKRPARKTTVRLGDVPPTPTAGGGGWAEVPLPKRSAVMVWTGRDKLLVLTIPVVIGGYAVNDNPVFPERTALTAMWRPDDPTEEPPVVKIKALGDAVPYQGLSYVITDLTWGSGAGDADGDGDAHRIMQKMVVTLTEYRADERLQITRVKLHHQARATRYTVRRGDTLKALARRFDITWQRLGEAQRPPIRDPRKIRVGQVLTIPSDPDPSLVGTLGTISLPIH